MTNSVDLLLQVIGLTISDEDEFPYDISRCEEKDPEESLWQNFTILNVVSGETLFLFHFILEVHVKFILLKEV